MKKVSLLGATKDKKMVYLDNFMSDYEWCVYENENNKDLYTIYDLQCGCSVEINYTLEQVINRVVGRALDYEINEHYDCFFEDFDCYNHKGYIDYINGLYEIAKQYRNNQDKYEEDWLFEIGKSIREMTRFFEEVNK